MVRKAGDSGPSLFPPTTPPPLYRINKEETFFFFKESDARNRSTSIRSRMILEFWNIWSLNLSFLRATGPNFL